MRQGRRKEFAAFGWDPEQIPDPQDWATFERSRLDWAEPGKEEHASLLAFYQRLIRLRRELPDLTDPALDRVSAAYDDADRWLAVRRGRYVVLANLAGVEQAVPTPDPVAAVVLASAEGFFFDASSMTLPAESVVIARLATASTMAG